MIAACRGMLTSALLTAGLLAPEAGAQPDDPAPAASHQPYQLTRSLQALQDQVALGSEAADAAQATLLVHIGERMMAADLTLFREPRNARAAVIYVLSGGAPHVLARLVQLEDPGVDKKIIKGAIAYASGRQDVARILLSEFDPLDFPRDLGGRLALVRASLSMKQRPEESKRFLETARLLMPGTLVEEAAVRRQLTVASELGDMDSFEFLSRQYFRRFGRSVYAGNLMQDFPSLWTKVAAGRDQDLARLEGVISGLAAEEQRALLLGVSREAVIAGDMATAQAAGTKAAALSDKGSTESRRAALYRAAATVASSAYREGAEALESIDETTLPEEDVELRNAALALAQQVARPLAEAEPPAAPANAQADLAQSEADVPGDTPAIVERARRALTAADRLLRSTQ